MPFGIVVFVGYHMKCYDRSISNLSHLKFPPQQSSTSVEAMHNFPNKRRSTGETIFPSTTYSVKSIIDRYSPRKQHNTQGNLHPLCIKSKAGWKLHLMQRNWEILVYSNLSRMKTFLLHLLCIIPRATVIFMGDIATLNIRSLQWM